MAANTINIVLEAQNQVSGPASRATKSIDNLNAATKRATLGTNQYGKAVDSGTRGLSKFAKSGLQQAGYQVGDFAVQVSGGTSALQAFGQQGSQLLGIFGPIGAILGAGVAIVAAVGTAYQKSSGNARDFKEALDTVNTALSEAKGFFVSHERTLENLEKKYGEVSENVLKLHNAQKTLALAELKTGVSQLTSAFTDEHSAVGDLIKTSKNLSDAEKKNSVVAEEAARLRIRAFDQFVNKMGVSVPKTAALSEQFDKLSKIDMFKKPAEAADVLNAAFGILTDEGFGNMSKESQALAVDLVKMEGLLREIHERTKEVAEASFESDNFMEAMRFHEQAIAKVDEAMKRQKETSDAVAKSMASSFGSAFKDIATGTKSVSRAFSDMAGQVIDRLFDILVVQRLVGTVGTSTTPGTGIAGFLSGRATGGPVTANTPYIVGERGPEIFMPSGSSGRIIPNNKIGGGVVVNNNLTINSDNAAAVRAEVVNMLPMIKEASKSAVLEASRRGGAFANSLGR